MIDEKDFKRCRRYNDPGHAHMLTFSCFSRKPFLSKDGSRQWLIDAFQAARIKCRFHIWAYVVMPEHAHLLLWPTEQSYNVSRFLEAIKLPVTRRALAFVKRHSPDFLLEMRDYQPNGSVAHRFWQRGGGHDRNVIEPKTVGAEIQYLHANPVRRGLCKRAEDWHWSSAADYAGVRTGPIAIDRESLPRLE